MTLARKLCGLVTLLGSAAPAAAQYTPPRPAPQGPTRLVFVAPPWITNGPRTGVPAGALSPSGALPANGALPPAPQPVPSVVPAVPAIPPVPPAGVTPASATTPRTVTRPDVWRSGTATLPGMVVPALPKGR